MNDWLMFEDKLSRFIVFFWFGSVNIFLIWVCLGNVEIGSLCWKKVLSINDKVIMGYKLEVWWG